MCTIEHVLESRTSRGRSKSLGAVWSIIFSWGLRLRPEVCIQDLPGCPGAGLGKGRQGQACLGAGVFTGEDIAGAQGLGHGAPQGRALLEEVGNLLPLRPDGG